MVEEKIQFVRTFTELSPNEKAFVFSESEQTKTQPLEKINEFGQKWRFIGLRLNGKLTSFVSFNKQDDRCLINRIWGVAPKEFVKTHKTTPAFFLIEDLIRQRAKTFVISGFTQKGEKFFSRKIAAGLFKRTQIPEIAFGLRVTPKLLKLAKSRKPFH